MEELKEILEEKKQALKPQKTKAKTGGKVIENNPGSVPGENTPKDIDTTIPVVEEKKQRKPRTPKTKKDEYNVENDIKLFLAGVSQIASSIPGGEIWQLHEQEISLISKPISNILERNNLSESASKYTDYTVLLIGLSIIIVPRVIFMKENSKKIKAVKGGLKDGGKEKETTRDSGKNDLNLTPDDGSDYSKVYSAVAEY